MNVGVLRISRAVLGNGVLLLALAGLAAALFTWQPDNQWHGWPRPAYWIGAGASILIYLGFSGWIMSRSRTLQAEVGRIDPDTVLVAHASQTGFAIELAMRTAQSLREGGVQVHMLSLGTLDTASLGRYRRTLFVVSTTGEGDPPDLALGFVQTVMTQPVALQQMQYAVLALGDTSYALYCGFGRQLDAWLLRHGATPLFDRVEVDNVDDAALRHWQHRLSLLAGNADLSHWRPPAYQAWKLRERRLLNPGSMGSPVYHLALTPVEAMPHWQAGDLVEIAPRHTPRAVEQWLLHVGLDGTTPVLVGQTPTPLVEVLASRQLPDSVAEELGPQRLIEILPSLPHRQYSIASLPADGRLHLLLRRMQDADGSVGLASGWLCDHAQPGAPIALRVRTNPNFHPPGSNTPLILIGNGTGIAGLRALLKARIAMGARRNWLLFGERQRAHDFHYGKDISTWQQQGWLERLDLVFSRDGAQHRHVQDALATATDALQHWIADGAAIYVCGSLEGMAPGVESVLQQALGHAGVETLRTQGRYRRDVY